MDDRLPSSRSIEQQDAALQEHWGVGSLVEGQPQHLGAKNA